MPKTGDDLMSAWRRRVHPDKGGSHEEFIESAHIGGAKGRAAPADGVGGLLLVNGCAGRVSFENGHVRIRADPRMSEDADAIDVRLVAADGGDVLWSLQLPWPRAPDQAGVSSGQSKQVTTRVGAIKVIARFKWLVKEKRWRHMDVDLVLAPRDCVSLIGHLAAIYDADATRLREEMEAKKALAYWITSLVDDADGEEAAIYAAARKRAAELANLASQELAASAATSEETASAIRALDPGAVSPASQQPAGLDRQNVDRRLSRMKADAERSIECIVDMYRRFS